MSACAKVLFGGGAGDRTGDEATVFFVRNRDETGKDGRRKCAAGSGALSCAECAVRTFLCRKTNKAEDVFLRLLRFIRKITASFHVAVPLRDAHEGVGQACGREVRDDVSFPRGKLDDVEAQEPASLNDP